MKLRDVRLFFLWPQARKTLIMASLAEIKYVNKVPRTDIHHAIRYVGGNASGGGVWKWDLAKAVSAIQRGEWQFFVNAGGKRTNVTVARSPQGHLYLKTEADSLYANNLLSLPEFP